VFKDKNVFNLSYIPPRFLYREQQLKDVAYSLVKQTNALVLGATGTGKTGGVKYVIDKYMDETPADKQHKIIYISCSTSRTTKMIVHNIYRKYTTGRSRITTIEMVNKLAEGNDALVILDEFDKLGVFQFNEIIKIFEIVDISAVFITNQHTFMEDIIDEIKNRLAFNVIEFLPYNHDQLRDIVRDRVETGFQHGVIRADEYGLIVANGVKRRGDARFAIQALKRAGEICEQKKKTRITKEMALKAMKDTECNILIDTIMRLDELGKIILVASGTSAHYSKDLYDIFVQVANKVGLKTPDYTTFWRRVNELEREYSLLAFRETHRTGKRGAPSRRIYSLIPQPIFEQIEEELYTDLGLEKVQQTLKG